MQPRAHGRGILISSVESCGREAADRLLQALQWPDGPHQTVPMQEVDKLPKGKPKGVGMCVGPIFSSTPTTLDWLQYYAGKPARMLPQADCSV